MAEICFVLHMVAAMIFVLGYRSKPYPSISLTLKAPIMATDDKFCDIFPNFRQKEGMILHENRLPADDSREIPCLIGYF